MILVEDWTLGIRRYADINLKTSRFTLFQTCIVGGLLKV